MIAAMYGVPATSYAIYTMLLPPASAWWSPGFLQCVNPSCWPQLEVMLLGLQQWMCNDNVF